MQLSSVTCLYIRCLDTSVFNFQNDKNRHFLGVLSKRNIYSASNYYVFLRLAFVKKTLAFYFFRKHLCLIYGIRYQEFFSAMPVTEEHFLHLSFFCEAPLMKHEPLFINLGHCFCV
jgi:hypothetical protein